MRTLKIFLRKIEKLSDHTTTTKMTSSTTFLVPVVYVPKSSAKTVKTFLEQHDIIDRRYRIAACTGDRANHVAIPILLEKYKKYITADDVAAAVIDFQNEDHKNIWEILVMEEIGNEYCKLSSRGMARGEGLLGCSGPCDSGDGDDKLSFVEIAVAHALSKVTSFASCISEDIYSPASIKAFTQTLILPKRLEVFGDPHNLTLFVTYGMFHNNKTFEDYLSRLLQSPTIGSSTSCAKSIEGIRVLFQIFYKEFADLYHAHRMVEKSGIDADSRVRESQCIILYHADFPLSSATERDYPPHPSRSDTYCYNGDVCSDSSSAIIESSSPGWVTVTEYGIPMSFDLTRVMYSRGNVTEKRRFGQTLVQSGEVIVDLYTGIGYYSLPALLHGNAAFVHACEWNVDAVQALKFNLQQNKVAHKAQVYPGDCRITALELEGVADRVSLGLLPSSEGGWPVAVRVLNKEKGGWLHVHGNVPVAEKDNWVQWLCSALVDIADSLLRGSDDQGWCVVCTNVQRVKSFAPKIDHVVADVYVGPKTSLIVSLHQSNAEISPFETIGRCGYWDKTRNEFVQSHSPIEAPSCALSDNGPLCQKWMRE